MMHSHLLTLLAFSALVSTVFATLLRDTDPRAPALRPAGLRGLRAVDAADRLADEPVPALRAASAPASQRGEPIRLLASSLRSTVRPDPSRWTSTSCDREVAASVSTNRMPLEPQSGAPR